MRHACVRRAANATVRPAPPGASSTRGSERSSLFVDQSRAEWLPRTMSTALFVSGRAATKKEGPELLSELRRWPCRGQGGDRKGLPGMGYRF